MAKTLEVARWARFLVVARRPAVLRDDMATWLVDLVKLMELNGGGGASGTSGSLWSDVCAAWICKRKTTTHISISLAGYVFMAIYRHIAVNSAETDFQCSPNKLCQHTVSTLPSRTIIMGALMMHFF